MKNQHFRISKLFPAFILIFIPFLSLNIGCSKVSSDDEKVVAVVNKEPISLEDFQREITLRSKQNPAYKITPEEIEGQLDTIIDKRLMIQEAMRMGLAGNENFVHTIKTFWEQTLIRELIENKNREWEGRLFVTEQEIKDYYSDTEQVITYKVIRTEDESKAKDLLEKAKKQAETLEWEVVGPVAYFDVPPGVLKKVFDMLEGQKKILRDGEEFLVISVEKKETLDLPPLEEIQNLVKREILERKKTEALEEWLNEVREKANIKINTKLIDTYLGADGRTDGVGGGNGR